MQRISDGHFRFEERVNVSDGITLYFTVDKIDGEELDTSVLVSGGFATSGDRRREFANKLGALIDRYRL
jgi:hypothetical protein